MNHIRHMGHDSCICMWYQSELQPPSPIAQFRGTRHKPSSLICQSRPSQSMHMKCDSTYKTTKHTHHNHISSRGISLYHNQLPLNEVIHVTIIFHLHLVTKLSSQIYTTSHIINHHKHRHISTHLRNYTTSHINKIITIVIMFDTSSQIHTSSGLSQLLRNRLN